MGWPWGINGEGARCPTPVMALEPSLIALRRRKVAGPFIAAAMLSFVFTYVAPMALALRIPSVTAALPTVQVPAFDFPAIPVQKLHAPQAVHHAARSYAHTVRTVRRVPLAMPPPVYRATQSSVVRAHVVTNKFELARPAKHASTTVATDPFANAPVVENAIGAVPPDDTVRHTRIDTHARDTCARSFSSRSG